MDDLRSWSMKDLKGLASALQDILDKVRTDLFGSPDGMCCISAEMQPIMSIHKIGCSMWTEAGLRLSAEVSARSRVLNDVKNEMQRRMYADKPSEQG